MSARARATRAGSPGRRTGKRRRRGRASITRSSGGRGGYYGRLLAAKDKYDPDRRFECWHCVGYAGVDVAEGDALPDGWGRDDTPCTACGPGLGECKTA